MKKSELIALLSNLIFELREVNSTSLEIAEKVVNLVEENGMMPPLTTVEFKTEKGDAQLFVDNVWENEDN